MRQHSPSDIHEFADEMSKRFGPNILQTFFLECLETTRKMWLAVHTYRHAILIMFAGVFSAVLAASSNRVNVLVGTAVICCIMSLIWMLITATNVVREAPEQMGETAEVEEG